MSKRSKGHLYLLALACSLTACGLDGPTVGSSRQAVVTGTGVSCDNPRVVFLHDSSGGIVCSGVVLRADLILTAAHCAFDSNALRSDVSQLSVGSGAAGCAYGSAVITAALAHPDYASSSSSYASDLAVLKLDVALPNVTAVTLGQTSVGSAVIASAFGVGDSGQTCMSGKVTDVKAYKSGAVSITADLGKHSVCDGDSGGGAFASSGELVGIVAASSGRDTFCGSTAIFAADWGFVGGAMKSMAGATAVSCSSGSSRHCLTAGQSCPDTSDLCRFGESTCQADGSWSTCAMSTIRVWDESTQSCVCTNTCPAPSYQDPSTCLCINDCGDTQCLPPENSTNCPQDCQPICGDTICAWWDGETTESCLQDCPPVCGDQNCNGGETVISCPADCGYCGDGYCASNESSFSCPSDCPSGGGGGGGGGGGTGGDDDYPWNHCSDPQDQYWTDTFGDDAALALLVYCGLEA